MAPGVNFPRHRALLVVRTRPNDISFFPALGRNDPFSERMHVPEPFWAPRLDHDNHATLSESLPKSFDNKLSALWRRNFLQHVAKNDQVEFASVATWNHSQRVNPEHFIFKLVSCQVLAKLPHVNIRFYSSAPLDLGLEHMMGSPGSRPQPRAVVQNRGGFEIGHPLFNLVQYPFVHEVVVRHFPVQVSNRTFPLIVEHKRLFLFSFLFVTPRLLIVHVNRHIFTLFLA